jgi:hypothetical protein
MGRTKELTEIARELEVPQADGRDWLERSLAAGFDVASAVLVAAPLDSGRFTTFIPASASMGQVQFPEHGFVGETVGNSGLSRYLDNLTRMGAACVVMEDDILERNDRQPEDMTVPSAFIGDGVIHWSNLKSGFGTIATKAVRESAFGHPLNAFVVTKSAADFGLVDDRQAPEGFAADVVRSLLAVIVSAFDAESFLVWDAPSLDPPIST